MTQFSNYSTTRLLQPFSTTETCHKYEFSNPQATTQNFSSRKVDSPANRLRFECELNAIPLILVKVAVLIFLFALVLERDNNETDKDVHHEERNDDDVNDIVSGNDWPEIVNRTVIFRIGVNGDVEQPRPTLKCRHGE